MEGLYDYYATKTIRPTHANFSDENELASYAELRQKVFHRLMFPPDMFFGKRVLEFGPDTGENSLVFAQWGSRLTLVEPNREAHPYIQKYFEKFRLSDRLDDVIAASLLEFESPRKFDIIDAEGFIYTVQPTSAWVKKTSECLNIGGYLIISSTTPHGAFIELLMKAIYQRVARTSGYGASVETAKVLFQPKWDRIPHTRTFESWHMDILENPFVRTKYFIDPVALLNEAHAGGYRLHSAWPTYADALSMSWIKGPLDLDADVRSAISFVEQSRVSHLLGCKCFVPGITRTQIQSLDLLVNITDGLIDKWSRDACSVAQECVSNIEAHLQVLAKATSDPSLQVAQNVLAMIGSAFKFLASDDVSPLIEFCRNDKTFMSTWGMPNHYTIFQRVC
jgi:hypothetical protein